MKENFYKSFDGKEIYYKAWDTKNKKAIVILHRWHEHSWRVSHIVEEIGLNRYAFFAWDARWHGKNSWKRGYADHFMDFVRDLEYFINHIENQYNIPKKDITIIAQSVWAVIAATWIHDFAPRINAAILASPAFNVNLIIPWAKVVLTAWQKIVWNFTVASYVKGKQLTHDMKRSLSYAKDPLVSLQIASNILLELYQHSKRIIDDASAIQLPILLLSSGKDSVVFKKEQDIFFNNLASKYKKKYLLEGFYHDTLWEKEREKAFQYIREFLDWIEEQKSEEIIPHAMEEFNYLNTKLPKFSFKNIGFTLTRFSLQKMGRHLSKWIAVAEKTGYDSWAMLDYVYENKAQGSYLIGKVFDRIFLNNIWWIGIRQRKEILEEALIYSIKDISSKEKPVNIMDIAAGHGKYVLETVKPFFDKIGKISLRDYVQENVNRWNEKIEKQWLQSKIIFEKMDAFDMKSYKEIYPTPNIVIVSGLYELYDENEKIFISLEGIWKSIEKGGYLIYTNQPTHPQIEFIARVLSSHKGNSLWKMRRRSQNEMDLLVNKAWFTKVKQYIDDWWMFTVSIAKKL